MKLYLYNYGQVCEDCGENLRCQITTEGFCPANPFDYHSYSSHEFPKGPFHPGESDGVEHCDMGEECKNAIDLGDGVKIGCWLENDLTERGIAYLSEVVSKGGAVAELWADWYGDYLEEVF